MKSERKHQIMNGRVQPTPLRNQEPYVDGEFPILTVPYSSKKSVSTALISYTCLVLTPTP